MKWFKIRKDEWLIASIVSVALLMLNLLMILKYPGFLAIGEDNYKDFIRLFRVSGFDPITYSVGTHWYQGYNVFRHPLLAYLMWPVSMLNGWLISVTGINLIQYIIAVILLFCGLYSWLFMKRILEDIICVKRFDAVCLSLMFMGFGYVMVGLVVPDHFAVSQMLLLLTFYICGMRMKEGKRLTIIETVLFFVITAGVTLSNGVKTYIAALFTNGKRFFHPAYLVSAVLLPAALLWCFAQWEYKVYVWPEEQKVKQDKNWQRKADLAQFAKAYADSTGETDEAKIEENARRLYKQHIWRVHKKNMKKPWNAHTGKPLANEGFMKWTDVSPDRWQTVVHNFFGETIQFHQDYLLEDTLKSRPVIVKYRWWINYLVEFLIVTLFIIGIWLGRKSRYLWMILLCFACDATLHLGLGFGINEVYIMGPHWLFVLPIATAYVLKHANGQLLNTLRILLVCLTAWLWLYNGLLLTKYVLL